MPRAYTLADVVQTLNDQSATDDSDVTTELLTTLVPVMDDGTLDDVNVVASATNAPVWGTAVWGKFQWG